MGDLTSRLRSFYEELRRRRVLRVAAVYAAVGWLVVEVSATTFPLLALPGWTATLVLVLVLLGFPLAVGLAWAFDVTPQGVRRAGTSDAGAASEDTTEERYREPAGVGRPVHAPSPDTAAAFSPGKRLLAGVAVALIVGSAAIAYRLVSAPGSPQAPDTPVVVVIPFENRTGDASLDPVGQMVAEWIAGGLEQATEVRVVPNSVLLEILASVRRDEGDGGGGSRLDRVAALTHAGIAVTGSYYRHGDMLELHSEAVDLRSHASVATVGPVRTSAQDPVAGIDSVRIQMMGALAARLSPQTAWDLPPGARPPTYQAYRAYADGLQAWSLGDYLTAGQRFREAFARDTTYLRALVMAYSAYRNAGDGSTVDSLGKLLWARRDQLPRYDRFRLEWSQARDAGDIRTALAAARAGAELNPAGTARMALFLSLEDNNRPREALDNVEGWLSAMPESETRWYAIWTGYARILHQLGRHQEELEVVRTARRTATGGAIELREAEATALAALDQPDAAKELALEIESVPASGLAPGRALARMALELRAHGNTDASFDVVDQAMTWLADRPAAVRDGPAGRELFGQLLYQRERWSEAANVWDALPDPLADSSALAGLLGERGCAAARLGDRPKAVALGQRLARFSALPLSQEATVYRAQIAAVLGDRDDAVELLKRAFASGQPYGIWVHREMDLEVLRGFGPYEQLVRPKG